MRLCQFLLNLLGNGAKFTVSGAVMPQIAAKPPAGKQTEVRASGC